MNGNVVVFAHQSRSAGSKYPWPATPVFSLTVRVRASESSDSDINATLDRCRMPKNSSWLKEKRDTMCGPAFSGGRCVPEGSVEG